jgi:hypothetical protein
VEEVGPGNGWRLLASRRCPTALERLSLKTGMSGDALRRTGATTLAALGRGAVACGVEAVGAREVNGYVVRDGEQIRAWGGMERTWRLLLAGQCCWSGCCSGE